jgi:hypothetical protein
MAAVAELVITKAETAMSAIPVPVASVRGILMKIRSSAVVVLVLGSRRSGGTF